MICSARLLSFLLIVLCCAAWAEEPAYRGLVCRAVEESGRLVIGQPGFGPHLISLFVTGPNPLSATQTVPEHVAWVNDPLHSYVPDGTGGMVIWAHPSDSAATILGTPGITGFELSYAGYGGDYDKLADELWRGCVQQRRPFLWGFAADDTHSSGPKGLSWFVARLPRADERALKQALRNGACYVSSGPGISDIQIRDGEIRLELEQEADVLWLRAGQWLGEKPPESFLEGSAIGENHCLRWDRAVRASALRPASLGVKPAELGFVRAIVRTGPSQMAQTQPFRLEADGRISNPYPASGVWIKGQTHNHTDTPPWASVSGLPKYRLAYQDKGEAAAFAADYSYWESPLQCLPSDGVPEIASCRPDRLPAGRERQITVRGLNFGAAPRVTLGARVLTVTEVGEGLVRARVPEDLPPGQYDLVVDNERFRGCRAQGLTVQAPAADLSGWRSYTVSDGLAHPQCLSVAAVGSEVWVGQIWGLSQLQGETFVNRLGDLAARSVYALAAGLGGELWAATEAGLARRDAAGKWSKQAVGQIEKIDKGRSAERWGRMALDPTGGLWVVNRWSAGLGLYRDGAWQRLTKADGLPANAFVSVACDGAGIVWLGGDYGLHRKVGERWEQVKLPAETAGAGSVSAMSAAPDGSLWVALTGRPEQVAVLRVQGETQQVLRPRAGELLPGRIRDLLVARNGDVWFATDLGVARRRADGCWLQYTTVNSGLRHNTVLGLAEDATGAVWFATADGVSCYSGG